MDSPFTPLVSTQCTEEPILEQGRAEEKRGTRQWTPTEDIVLISSWLNICKDPFAGYHKQSVTTFWKRVVACFGSSPELVGFEKREPNDCKQRWEEIDDLVCKFVGAYEFAIRFSSGRHNDDEILKVAHEIFYSDHKQKFTLEHAWKEMRKEPKWCASVDEPLARPPGVKAARAAAKRKRSVSKTNTVESESTSLSKVESMWATKKKDYAMKERQLKINILDSLIAKNEPLSEIDEALKNKLISMLSN